ncbi:MAG: glycosyltransferase family 87 protein [Alphaproteobacteria bacterium]
MAQHSSFWDGNHRYYGLDFVNFWAAPRIVHADLGALFSVPAYNSALSALYGAALPLHVWSYPPSALLLLEPFSRLPYWWAFALWTALGAGLYLFCVLRGVPPGQRRIAALLALCAPAALLNALGGQNGFFTASLTLGALSLMRTEPPRAGALIGLFSLKPQLGFVWPVLLIARRRWDSIGVAILVAMALIGLFPRRVRQRFLARVPGHDAALAGIVHRPAAGQPQLRADDVRPAAHAAAMGHGDRLGVPLPAAAGDLRAGHAGAGVQARSQFSVRALLVTSGGLLLSPYLFNYDMVGLAGALTWRFLDERPLSDGRRFVYALGYLLPGAGAVALFPAAGGAADPDRRLLSLRCATVATDLPHCNAEAVCI